MKDYITVSLLLFTLETIFHGSIIIIYSMTGNESYPYDPAMYGMGYVKLKLIFFLLPYLIAHTYLMRNKKIRKGIVLGLFQVGLFASLTVLFFPVGGMLVSSFLSFEIIAAILFCSFITPLIILKLAGRR